MEVYQDGRHPPNCWVLSSTLSSNLVGYCLHITDLSYFEAGFCPLRCVSACSCDACIHCYLVFRFVSVSGFLWHSLADGCSGSLISEPLLIMRLQAPWFASLDKRSDRYIFGGCCQDFLSRAVLYLLPAGYQLFQLLPSGIVSLLCFGCSDGCVWVFLWL